MDTLFPVPRRYRIADLCRRYEVTARALRFYEENGLMNPARDSGGRLYLSGDVARLETILMYKSFGLTLSSIRELILRRDTSPADHLAWELQILDNQRPVLERKLAELRQCLVALDGARHRLRSECSGNRPLSMAAR